LQGPSEQNPAQGPAPLMNQKESLLAWPVGIVPLWYRANRLRQMPQGHERLLTDSLCALDLRRVITTLYGAV